MHQRLYGIVFPQAYLELFAPPGNGLKIKLGEFYTLIGNEAVNAPDNFFYSHSYTMQFGEPFSHTGLLASYSIDENLELKAGAVTGSPYVGTQPCNTIMAGLPRRPAPKVPNGMAWLAI
ncbi:hypothetical protein A1332_21675 [Methylomonas methanica]|uniref:Uncharacterized protein n=1 Tax=Methylomonas methanica TaxID=421 RepID=A0A177LXL3_METMH|nr:hypothetical protein A1332_21675 [Methylomonas methanica]